MNSFVFRDIINRILDTEHIDLTTLALKANANRSYLSKVKNSVDELEIGPTILRKVKRAFPSYFDGNNENNIAEENNEPTPMQIFHLLAKTLESHGRILDRIDEKVAREDTQARIETNSIEILAGVRSLSIRQKRAIAENKHDLAELKSQTPRPNRGLNKKSGQTDGVGKKQGRKPPSGS